MIREDGQTLRVEGPLTLATVARLVEEGQRLVAAANRVIDLSAVSQVDSAALALLSSWVRAAHNADKRFSIVAAPPALLSLASLYDVDTILLFGR